jgi:uncharacterized repeat protein (TIGR03803 family)
MKLKNLAFAVALTLATNLSAQTFTILHTFMPSSSVVYVGAGSYAGLILSGNTLYGTAISGGSPGSGAVFAINTDGTAFTNLYNFTATSGSYPNYTNSDGAIPQATLILSGSTLYGTTEAGGSSCYGTVFKVNTNGTGFSVLHSFPGTGNDGSGPPSGLILSGNTLYGTASGGGSSSYGTVFAVHTNGTGFTNLHSFNYSDGYCPYAGLILSGNTLYGTTEFGGNSGGYGTVFKVNVDGTGFTNLYSFTGGSDGAYPWAGLVLMNNTLYGTTSHTP